MEVAMQMLTPGLSLALLLTCVVSATGDVTVRTRTGDTLVGTSVTHTAHAVYLRHPLLGVVKLSMADVLDIDAGPDEVVHVPAQPPLRPLGRGTHQPMTWNEAVLAHAEQTPDANPWIGGLGAALTVSRATEETLNLRLNARLTHSDEAGSTNLEGTWYLNLSDGEVTDNDMLVRGDRDWALSESPLDWFVQSTWQFDQFEQWAHRVSPYTGLGWTVLDDEEASLTLKGGGGATWEYGSGIVRPQLLLEADGQFALSQRHAIKGYASIAPSVRSLDDYLATLRLVLQIQLRDDASLALNVGVRNIYDSTPGAGATHNDFKLWTGLDWTF
jgi:hypothetical protein